MVLRAVVVQLASGENKTRTGFPRRDLPGAAPFLAREQLVVDAWREVLGEGFLGMHQEGVIEGIGVAGRQGRRG